MRQKQKRPPFGLRMPEDLHEWVKEQAAASGRSMNNFVVHLISTAKEKASEK